MDRELSKHLQSIASKANKMDDLDGGVATLLRFFEISRDIIGPFLMFPLAFEHQEDEISLLITWRKTTEYSPTHHCDFQVSFSINVDIIFCFALQCDD